MDHVFNQRQERGSGAHIEASRFHNNSVQQNLLIVSTDSSDFEFQWLCFYQPSFESHALVSLTWHTSRPCVFFLLSAARKEEIQTTESSR